MSCHIGNVTFKRTSIDACSFEATRSKGTRFERCSIKDTRVSGKFVNLVLLENDLRNVDFADTDLRSGVLAGTRIAVDVKLPKGPNSFVVPGEALTRVRGRLANQLDAVSLDDYDKLVAAWGIPGQLVNVSSDLVDGLTKSAADRVLNELSMEKMTNLVV